MIIIVAITLINIFISLILVVIIITFIFIVIQTIFIRQPSNFYTKRFTHSNPLPSPPPSGPFPSPTLAASSRPPPPSIFFHSLPIYPPLSLSV